MTDTRRLQPFPYTPAPQLVGDIGGTNARLALADHGVLRPGSIRRIAVAGQNGLPAVLRDYMAAQAVSECAGLCLAVAGPVRDGRVEMTNLGWVIEAEALRDLVPNGPIHLLNDLQAQGHGLDAVLPAHMTTLIAPPAMAEPERALTRLVVGIGTGFNAAVVHPLAQGVLVPPAEAGHVHLPTQDRDERAFARSLAARHGLATVEEALSGRGLEALHAWTSGATLTAADIAAGLAAGEPAARQTGALYARLLGRALGDLALTHLPWGGIYLIGGVARALAPHLPDLGLATAMRQMGRYSALMERIGLHLVRDDNAALLGAARHLETRRGAAAR